MRHRLSIHNMSLTDGRNDCRIQSQIDSRRSVADCSTNSLLSALRGRVSNRIAATHSGLQIPKFRLLDVVRLRGQIPIRIQIYGGLKFTRGIAGSSLGDYWRLIGDSLEVD